MAAFKPTASEAWAALTRHRESMVGVHMRDLFAADGGRFDRYSRQVCGLTVDFSKQRLTDETLDLLLALAGAADIEGKRQRLFTGEAINESEDRAVLHMALRDLSDRAYAAKGEAVTADIAAVRERMLAFAADVIGGRRVGYTGKRFDTVINIGIGGSDLGPRCAVAAMADDGDSPLTVHFVSTLDGTQLHDVLAACDPETTVVVICSKSFSTQETKANADTARAWLVAALGEDAIAAHVVAVSSKPDKAAAFGIDPANVLPMWDWVGGRYSLWSAIGLSVALACGPEAFKGMLAGAAAMDRHFETAPLADNVPVLLALLDIWNGDFWDASATAVLPYDHRLRLFPAHLQQVIMESNGKGVRLDGQPAATDTSQVIFGGPGSDSQHSFMQMVHQGPRLIPVDFIIALEAKNDPHRDGLMANALAQAEALMKGRNPQDLAENTPPDLVPHRVCPGNRPSTTILADRLTPETFGALLALYEHRTFSGGVLWGLNSYDQWGVELGKELAQGLMQDISQGQISDSRDCSTSGLLTAYLRRRKTPEP